MTELSLLEAIATQAATVIRLRDHFAVTGDWQARSDYHAALRQLKALLDRRAGTPQDIQDVSAQIKRLDAEIVRPQTTARRAGKPEGEE